MNRFSTLTAALGIAAAATLAQPLAAHAAVTGHPAMGIIHTMPGMDPLPGHGIVVDPIVGRPVLNPVRQDAPITPIKRAPGVGTGNDSKPVIGTGNDSKPVIGTGNDSKPVIGTGNDSKPVIGTGNASKPVIGTGNASKPVFGHSGQLIPVDPIPLPRRPVVGHPRKPVPLPIRSEKP
jgi:hypothetical protein